LVATLLLLVLGVMSVSGQEVVTLRMTWYNDGNEGDVMRALLDQFEAENPDIKIEMDVIAYADLHNILQAQVETGEAPDMARVTLVDRFVGNYLDLTPYVDAEYWTTNFPKQALDSMRADADDTGIYGYPMQFTVTGPFVNRTLFELAGVDVPSDVQDEVSWDEWEAAVREVQEATGTPYAFAVDRTGHRFWGFSLSQGASYINEDGTVTMDTEGFRAAAERLLRWQEEGLMPAEIWGGAAGQFAAANEYFVRGEVIFYLSGSWQVGQFTTNIDGGENPFDWSPVPNPTDVNGSTGIPGGALLVAFQNTQHPEEVARVMDYLAGEEAYREFAEQSLFLPAHLGLAEAGLEYPANSDKLGVFVAEIPKLSDQAYKLQYSPFTSIINTTIRDRLSQVAAGELTLVEAIEAAQADIDTQIEEAKASASI
jgi:alpha-1,4-digalacturonate transport system substrate-binding protein